MALGPPLSADEIAQIHELRAENVCGRQIAIRLGRSVNLIATYLRNPGAYGTAGRRLRGRSPVLDDNLKRIVLEEYARGEKTITQIVEDLPVPVSRRTVTNFLKTQGHSIQRERAAGAAVESGATTPGSEATTQQHEEQPQRQQQHPRAPSLSFGAPQTAATNGIAPSMRATGVAATSRAVPATTTYSNESQTGTRELVGLLDRRFDALTKLVADQNTLFSQLVNGQNALIGQLVVVQNTMTQMLQLQQQQQNRSDTSSTEN